MEADVGGAQGAEVVLSLMHEPLTANAVAAALLQSRLSNVERVAVLEALGVVYATNSADQDVAEALARTAGITGRLGLQMLAKAVCELLDIPPVAVRSGLKETAYARALASSREGVALLTVLAETLAASHAKEAHNGPPSYKRAVATLELAGVLSEVSPKAEQVLEPMTMELRALIEAADAPDGPAVA
jgi:hypothetical protein